MFRALIKSTDAARKGWRGAYAQQRAVESCSLHRREGTFSAPLKHRYWVTSERGVYLVRDGEILLVAPVPCYGIAFHGEAFFLTAYFGHYTAVLKGDRVALQSSGRPFGFKELHGYPTLGSNERIHQAFCSGADLWAASTGRNTLLRFDASSDQLLTEWPLFYDAFGKPILHDNHHVNSVAAYGDVILFVAYRTGSGSLLGMVHQGEVIGWPYPHKGVHDFFLTRDNFFFCDTFGSGKPNTGGCALDKQGVIDPDYFARPPGFVVRGLAGDQEEMVIGHSHKGERRKRFSGHGSLLVVRERRVVHEITLPCAQVYQVAIEDGSYLNPPPTAARAEEIAPLFSSLLGKPVYRVKLQPLAQL